MAQTAEQIDSCSEIQQHVLAKVSRHAKTLECRRPLNDSGGYANKLAEDASGKGEVRVNG